MRHVWEVLFEFTKSALTMRPLRGLFLEVAKSAYKFALFQYYIPCPQKMQDTRIIKKKKK